LERKTRTFTVKTQIYKERRDGTTDRQDLEKSFNVKEASHAWIKMCDHIKRKHPEYFVSRPFTVIDEATKSEKLFWGIKE